MPTAIITGITGQDGSYLAEFLITRGYRVIGIVRPDSESDMHRISSVVNQVKLIKLDLTDQDSLELLLREHNPDEFYNLAARASSLQLYAEPILTTEYNGVAVVRILEGIRRINPLIRLCQASSSEMYGNASASPQSETTPFSPLNPYGIAKLFGHQMIGAYRRTHGIFACSAILFNHESPRRGLEFLTRKISRGAASIAAGLSAGLALGNLDATRDWGYAADYVRAMWMMLQHSDADDYVLATGKSHSVRQFCEIAFNRVGLNYKDHVVEDEKVKRAPEAVIRVGDPTKACVNLGWQHSVGFERLVCMMADADVRLLQTQV
jgi:GDPmannose 4,6-dehydratase